MFPKKLCDICPKTYKANLISLIGDVRKNWGSGVKNKQCVTEATEKLREVLQIPRITWNRLMSLSLMSIGRIKVDFGVKFLLDALNEDVNFLC